jgi:hypothetical protein
MANDTLTIRHRIWAAFQFLPGGALLFALVPMVVFGYLGWYYYAADRIDRTLYSLSLDQIQISTQPDWIKSSVLESVFKEKRLDRVNLLDPTANAYIASAFETSPWVKSTTRVRKLGGQVIVDLVFRQPLAMLKVSYQDRETMRWEDGFYPLDGYGYVLPKEDFTQSQISDYLLIDIENIGTPSGAVYADGRVHQALKLISVLESSGKRKQLGVEWINVRRDNDVSIGKPWILQLWTIDRRMIVWGHSPGEEVNGEPDGQAKLANLEKWLKAERERGSEGGTFDLTLGKTVSGQTTSY